MYPGPLSVTLRRRSPFAEAATISIKPASLRFDTFFVVSNNRWSYRDLEHARQVLGWAPIDSADRHRS